MKKITDITRRDIFDIIKSGFVIQEEIHEKNADFSRYEDKTVYMPYYGRLSEIDFLRRLYPLDDMPSGDSRFKNASGDIWQHTINNDDWNFCWVLADSRFNLSDGNDDEPLLKFLCEMLHPVVRIEDGNWHEYLKKFNALLSYDGYILFEQDHISGRSVYSYRRTDAIAITNPQSRVYAQMKSIGGGSYAEVYSYFDSFYNKKFALKRAKQDLCPKEIARFKREFDEMKKLKSPYVLEVYDYNAEKNEYIMELGDCTLFDYIQKNNASLTMAKRNSLVLQLLRGVEYIHKQGLLHRDLSPRNVIIFIFDDVSIVKISDFGLVKIPDSDLTSLDTDIKGSFNDPALKTVGFAKYDFMHEIYALTLLITYIYTGKTNWDKIKDEQVLKFMHKGTNPDVSKRFASIQELMAYLPFAKENTKHFIDTNNNDFSIDARNKISDEIDVLMNNIIHVSYEDEYGNVIVNNRFICRDLLAQDNMPFFFRNLSEKIDKMLFIKETTASLVFDKIIRIEDKYTIPVALLSELLEYYKKFITDYPDYIDQFLFAVMTHINKNYSTEPDLPF